jgi:hypothetical protein
LAILALIASLAVPVWSVESSTTLLGGYSDTYDYHSFGAREHIVNFDDTEESSTTWLTDVESDLQGPLVLFIK